MINSFVYKIFLIVLMLLDHISYIIAPYYLDLAFILNVFGRMCFPLFCFFVVEGGLKTKNFEGYLSRLLVFSLISIVPYSAYFHLNHFVNSSGESLYILNGSHGIFGNVGFTLFWGAFIIYILRCFSFSFLQNVFWVVFASISIIFMDTDGSICIPILAMVFFYFGLTKPNQLLIFLGFLTISSSSIVLYFYGQMSLSVFILKMFFLVFAPFFFTFIYLFKGAVKGFSSKNFFIKYLLYIFYPLHLIVLFVIRTFFGVNFS